MHPSNRLRGTKTRHLEGTKIVLAVSGSIAAVEAVKIAHELQRHGAEVLPVMTRAASELLGPAALEYATGHAPLLTLTGQGEHVKWCGKGGEADLLLIAPATANTIAKVALGIDDNAVTSCATVAIGSGLPVVIAPAMHEVMGDHPAVKDRLRDLERVGVTIAPPRVEEEKAKLASAETIADVVCSRLAKGPLRGRSVLVISGSTAEPLDPVRVLTNRSSGRLGVELAVEAYRRGARVDLWNAWGSIALPDVVRVRRFQTVGQLLKLLDKYDVSRYDVILVPAALSDFAPAPAKEKIPTDQGAVEARLEALPKVLPRIRKDAPDAFLVGFKAESDPKILVDRARERMASYKANLFVGNLSDAFGATETTMWIVAEKGKPREIKGHKRVLAATILDDIGTRLERGV
jgi:phosphopantothenoylcysteine decarboxylase / phosphopantothenate---cysteine ligase